MRLKPEEIRERVRELYARAEEGYESRLRPVVPGSPPFWLFSLLLAVGLVGVMWSTVFALLGGWHVLTRMVNFLSEATRVYEPTP